MAMADTGGAVGTRASGENLPAAVAVDKNHIYWADNNSSGAIVEVPIGGGTTLTPASGLWHPQYIAIDSTYVYRTQLSPVWKVPISGATGAIEIASNGGGVASGIAVDSTSVYWGVQSSATSDGKILKRTPK